MSNSVKQQYLFKSLYNHCEQKLGCSILISNLLKYQFMLEWGELIGQ